VHSQSTCNFLKAVVPAALLLVARSSALPEPGQNKVAYYAFDATPVGQGILPLTTFTDNANIIIVFEGTLWELADTVHYKTGAMRNTVYTSKKKVLEDIQTLRKRGVLVLMNVDDAASWSTATPFTTWDKKTLDYKAFAAFVDSCVTVVGFDGISLDVEHKAVDNADYRNLIKELGKYFGPLSSNAASKIYTGAFYTSQFTAPGTIFREVELGKYFNFVMDMGYSHDNAERFKYWASTLGNSKVMDGMSHQYNKIADAVAWAAWHPTPDKAGVMVFAGNVNKPYTDSIFAALGGPSRAADPPAARSRHQSIRIDGSKRSVICSFSLATAAAVSLRLFSLNGKACATIIGGRYGAGDHKIRMKWADASGRGLAPGVYEAVFKTAGDCGVARFVVD
jgi:hypothetical protein